MPPLLSNQGCHTPINPLPMIFHLRAPHSRNRNLPTRTNTPITTCPTNLRSAIAREMVGCIRDLTILSKEMNPITMFPLPPTNTLYPSHHRDLQDPHPFRPRASPAARNEEFTTTRGSARGRTSAATDLREMTGIGSGMD